MSAAEPTTAQILASFGGVEDDQRYTRLVENFADDGIYYDPFFGPQVGKVAITTFMSQMEEAVPASGARFENWTVTAGINCGFAEWAMVAPNGEGRDVPVLGESLYRLVDGRVTGVVDYVDPIGYRHLRGESGRTPDYVAGGGALAGNGTPTGAAAEALVAHVNTMTHAGRWAGTATLVDHAGEETVGWAQWIFHGPHGDFAGWSLHRPSGFIRDLFDTVTATNLATG